MPKINEPLLIFNMHLDGKASVPGLNQGRLTLADYATNKVIQRWVFTTSFDNKQNIKDWDKRGGVIPPTVEMPGMSFYEVGTNLIVQPGQPVDEGYIVYYNGSNTWTTKSGATRSEIMIHEDKNVAIAPGSYGCLAAVKSEWSDFKKVFKEFCGHLGKVKMVVVYSF